MDDNARLQRDAEAQIETLKSALIGKAMAWAGVQRSESSTPADVRDAESELLSAVEDFDSLLMLEAKAWRLRVSADSANGRGD